MPRSFRFLSCALVVVLLALASWGGIHHHRSMQQALAQLQADNQADTIFTSDSAALRLVRYFDWFGTHNEQLLAHYLLGRAYADMGEAPQAIEAYHTAIDCADTTASSCNFRVLRSVYGQMAEVFDAQNLPEDELWAERKFIKLSWRLHDVQEALYGKFRLEKSYFLLGQLDSIVSNAYETRRAFLSIGDTIHAAHALFAVIYVHTMRSEYDRAREAINILYKDADIWESANQLKPGKEMLYYTIGFYLDEVNQLDSAEWLYRKALAGGKYEAGYKGLLSVYEKRKDADSIARYARLYADANDAMHRDMNSQVVHQTSALYNYNRHLQKAQQSSMQALFRLIIIIVCIAVILLLSLIYIRMLQKKRKQERQLDRLRQLFIENDRALNSQKQQLSLQQAKNQDLLDSVADLEAQKEQLTFLLEQLQGNDRAAHYYASDPVQAVMKAVIFRTIVPSAKTTNSLHDMFSSTFPHFADYVRQTHELTEDEWDVCMYVDLGFSNGEMAYLMNLSPQRINGLKTQVNHNLFQTDDASSLRANLWKALH